MAISSHDPRGARGEHRTRYNHLGASAASEEGTMLKEKAATRSPMRPFFSFVRPRNVALGSRKKTTGLRLSLRAFTMAGNHCHRCEPTSSVRCVSAVCSHPPSMQISAPGFTATGQQQVLSVFSKGFHQAGRVRHHYQGRGRTPVGADASAQPIR